MRGLVIFGLTDAAELAHFHFSVNRSHDIAAFCVDGAYLKESSFLGLPVVAMEEVGQVFPADTHDAFVAVGYSRLNRLRAAKCAAMRESGYKLVSCLSRQAIVAPDLVHGENCFVMEGCIIEPGVRLGRHVTMWGGSMVSHHSIIGDNVFLAPRVAIAGRVIIDDNCFLGVNVTVRDHVHIGRDCVLGAGAVALHDLSAGTVLDGAAATLRKIDIERVRD